ncbi:MBL fold metallo-hydrolase [Pseudonocardia sichuanensis]
MCDLIGSALPAMSGDAGISRRNLLRATGTAVAASALGTAVASCSGTPSTAAATATAAGPAARTRLVLLGTTGGPTILDPARAGTSTAVVYDGGVHLVDLGFSAHQRLVAAGLGGGGWGNGFGNLRSILFTHMHSDHVTEWPAIYSVASTNIAGRLHDRPIEVFGPGDRGSLPRVFPAGRTVGEPINPEDPTPGIVAMTGYLRRAWAGDFNDRLRNSSFRDPTAVFSVHDIDVSTVWAGIDPKGMPPRLTEPIPVWTDGDVRITATLVDHHPTAPAFGFRFDTPDGSIVVSGDTCPSENLIDLARGADYLVHEVIDPLFVEELVKQLPAEQADPLRTHLLESHTTIDQVGPVAEAARVGTLVLSHLAPAHNPPERWLEAQKGFSGRLIVGADLMQLPVGQDS